MGLIYNFDDIDIYPIEKVCEHADNVIKMNYSHPACVMRKIYSISTEMQEGFLSGADLKEKRILTVGSSGDQIFDYALSGSKDITVMDSNFLTLYFCELKYAALKTLNREEFIQFFTNNHNDKFMLLKIYDEKIKDYIKNDNVKKFWDYILKKEPYYISNLFHHDYGVKPSYLVNDQNYYSLRKVIDSVLVKFHCVDLSDFHTKAEGEYDMIDLSNILTYMYSEKQKMKYWDSVNNLYNFLSKDGILKLNYGKVGKFKFTFMDKQIREIPIPNTNSSIILWDNDEERYNNRKDENGLSINSKKKL